MSSKSVSQIFKMVFYTGDIDDFVLCGVFFSRYVQLKRLSGVFFSRYVQLKSSFSDEKTSAGKSETHFSREAIKV